MIDQQSEPQTFYHGGPSGLKEILQPSLTGVRTHSFFVDPGGVYITTSQRLASYHASSCSSGSVYEVSPVGALRDDPEGPTGQSYLCDSAKVLRERVISQDEMRFEREGLRLAIGIWSCDCFYQELTHQRKTNTSITKNPLPIPLEQLGVTDKQFTHFSGLHGMGHVNRVIVNALNLAKCTGRDEWMPAVWAAAYLHDLSRRDDGPCEEHGQWAVKEQWDEYLPLFREAGVAPGMDSIVQDAVAKHAIWMSPEEEKRQHVVTSLLKDADALDRCRLGDLDPRMLRLEHAPGLIEPATRLYAETFWMDTEDWLTVWHKGRKIYNP